MDKWPIIIQLYELLLTAINATYSPKDTDQPKIHVLTERKQLEKE